MNVVPSRRTTGDAVLRNVGRIRCRTACVCSIAGRPVEDPKADLPATKNQTNHSSRNTSDDKSANSKGAPSTRNEHGAKPFATAKKVMSQNASGAKKKEDPDTARTKMHAAKNQNTGSKAK